MRFKIDWASLKVGTKFTVFALFYFVSEGNFPSRSPQGAYIWRGDLTEGFLRYRFGGLIFGGAYSPNFTVFSAFSPQNVWSKDSKQNDLRILKTFFFNTTDIDVLKKSFSVHWLKLLDLFSQDFLD